MNMNMSIIHDQENHKPGQDPPSKPTEAAIPISSQDPFESSFQHQSPIPTERVSEKQSGEDYSKSKYNSDAFELQDSDTNAYIFKAGLFTRCLLPIEPGQHRKIKVFCTL